MEKKKEKATFVFAKQKVLYETFCDLVDKGAKLSLKQQLKICKMPNGGEILLMYVRKGSSLYDEVQVKVCEMPNGREILQEHIKHGHYFCDEAVLKICEMPNAGEILLEYAKLGWRICDEARLKVFELEDVYAKAILMEIIKRPHSRLCKEVVRKILKLRGAWRIKWKLLICGYDFR